MSILCRKKIDQLPKSTDQVTLMPSLYNFIIQRLTFFEKRFPNGYENKKSGPSRHKLEKNIILDARLQLISDFLNDANVQAIDKTPSQICDEKWYVSSCRRMHHNHKVTPCALTGREVSATVFKSNKSETYLLFVEVINTVSYGYKSLYVLCRPNQIPIYWSMWAARIYHGMVMSQMYNQYKIHSIDYYDSFPRDYYFRSMHHLLKNHQLLSIKHDHNDAWEETHWQKYT